MQIQPSKATSSNQNTHPLLLVYYNFKGIGQMIRYLLSYLRVEYVDIMLDEYQKQKNMLSKQILQALRSQPIIKNDLPAIIHNNQIVYELNQVMNYLCLTFNREDLLGINIYQKARVCEIQQLYTSKLTANIKFLSAFVGEVSRTSLKGVQFLAFVQSRLNYFFGESGYFRQLSDYLKLQQNQKFILQNITVIDFYFIQTSKFALGLFSNIDEELAQAPWTETARNYRLAKQSRGQNIQYAANLRAMRRFINFITNQQFYRERSGYFQSFKQFPKSISGQQQQGMNRLSANYFVDLYYINSAQ